MKKKSTQKNGVHYERLSKRWPLGVINGQNGMALILLDFFFFPQIIYFTKFQTVNGDDKRRCGKFNGHFSQTRESSSSCGWTSSAHQPPVALDCTPCCSSGNKIPIYSWLHPFGQWPRCFQTRLIPSFPHWDRINLLSCFNFFYPNVISRAFRKM